MKKITILLLLFAISLPVVLPYFHNGYFPTHDGEWAVVRLGDMFRTLRDLQFPARYSGNLNFGYGYPLFNFTYPFPYYLGIILYFFGFGFVGSIKLIFASTVILSSIFMFLASRILWKSTLAGIGSALLYVYLPYRMVDLYVRGSIGESIAFVLFPLLFYLVIKFIEKPRLIFLLGTSFTMASLIMTHNIMTVLFFPLFLSFAIFYSLWKNKNALKPFFISLLLGLGLSAFFWVPALLEKNNILLSKIPIADRDLYYVRVNQLISSDWGYGVPAGPDAFSYQLGLPQIGIAALAMLFLFHSFIFSKKFFKDNFNKIAPSLVILISIYGFLLFKPSEFLWKNVPLLSEINYPWISLGILGFLISLLSGFLSKSMIGKYVLIIFSILAVVFVFPNAKPQYYIDRGDSYYLTNEATTTSSNELMPLWVKKEPSRRPVVKAEIIKGTGEINNLIFNSKMIKLNANLKTESLIRVNTIYYPGWKAEIDNKLASISYENEMGLMDIPVSSGRRSLELVFEETTPRFVSDMISLVSLVIAGFLFLKHKKI